MSDRVTRVVHLIAVCVVMSSLVAPPLLAQTDSTSDKDMQSAQDIEACSKNLKQIYVAIQAYQRDNKDIPNWLSDLVPQYISDPSVLECPICKRTGKTESTNLADPKLPSCYLFEFAPGPILSKDPAISGHTRREWKRKQMALVGTMIPIVRCRQHGVVLNLAYDGRIYESPGRWENLLTNHMDTSDLTAERMFSASPPVASSAHVSIARNPAAKPGMVDLTEFYNATLTESWHGGTGNDLAALPSGVQHKAGVDWDIRGIVQLAGQTVESKKFPEQVTGIKISQKCQRLHFLHASGFGKVSDEGTEIGVFVVHYTNRLRLEIPIRYGQEVRDWHSWKDEPPPLTGLTVAWSGQNDVSRAAGRSIRLFKTTWANPFPDIPIESLDYVSRMTPAAPFLIAITTE